MPDPLCPPTLITTDSTILKIGVVEAASSSLVTQTSSEVHNEPPIFFYFLAKSLEISRFRDKHNGLVLPYFEG